MNFSNLKMNMDNNYTVLATFNTGIFSNFYFSDKYFLDVELLYSVKGYRTISIPAGTTKNRLNYLSLPVLMGVKAGKKVDFVLGPEISYLPRGVMIDESGKSIITDYYQKFDIGIDAGAGYDLSKKIKLEVRYNYGLSKVAKEYMLGGSGITKSGLNRVFQFDVAYIF